MKTAKDILNLFSNPLVILLSDEDKIQLMKEYAHQVATQALKDAAENAKVVTIHSSPPFFYVVDKESITNTKIITL